MDQQLKNNLLKNMDYNERTFDIFERVVADEILVAYERLPYADTMDELKRLQGRIEGLQAVMYQFKESKKKSIKEQDED